MDTGFWAGTAYILLGGYLAVLVNAIQHAGTKFSLTFWLTNNTIRFMLIGTALVAIRIIVHFEGLGFIESLKAIGVTIPALYNSVIGFGLTYFIMHIQMEVEALPAVQKAMVKLTGGAKL